MAGWSVQGADGNASLRFEAQLPPNPLMSFATLILDLTPQTTRQQADTLATELNARTAACRFRPIADSHSGVLRTAFR
jgi:hypothetical protein